jgi:hypothetical protein
MTNKGSDGKLRAMVKKRTTSSQSMRLTWNAGIGESARRAFAGMKETIRYGKKQNPQPGHS